VPKNLQPHLVLFFIFPYLYLLSSLRGHRVLLFPLRDKLLLTFMKIGNKLIKRTKHPKGILFDRCLYFLTPREGPALKHPKPTPSITLSTDHRQKPPHANEDFTAKAASR
jgi:hypothetical protein